MDQDLGQMLLEGFLAGAAGMASSAWEWAVTNPLPAIGLGALVTEASCCRPAVVDVDVSDGDGGAAPFFAEASRTLAA